MVVRVLIREGGNQERREKFIEAVVGHRHAEALPEAAPAGAKRGSRTTGHVRDLGVERRASNVHRIREVPEREPELACWSQGSPAPEVLAFDPALQLSGQMREVVTVSAVGDGVGRNGWLDCFRRSRVRTK